MTRKQTFKGDQKKLVHLLVPLEKAFLKSALPLVPQQIGTRQLTLMTLLWSLGIVGSGYLSSQGDLRWLWMFSACIFMQYLTDMLDGEVGRTRHSGFVKWGFYMDHFLDYVFLSSIIIGYSFLLPSSDMFLALLCLAFSAGFMVHTFMDFSITNNLKISCGYFGVSEMRMSLILFNIALMVLGQGLLVTIFPYFVLLAGIGLLVLVFTSQKTYQHIDAIWQGQEELID